ncbi:MAG: linear amide C-N hydrolase [Lawsonibacter sp.]|nr:linear amide C-N hydrolase [Lawsonibacter sp.]
MDFGCSSFIWRTEDGRHLLGRTYDQFGDLAANRVISVPRGCSCAPGLHGEGAVSGAYGCTGMAVLGFGEPILVDGVNSAGLMGALLHFPEYAVYEESAGPSRTAVHPGRLLAWLLGRCAGVKEAVEELSRLTLVDEPIQGKPLPAHYILSDKTGEAVIIEPEEGGLSIHRKTIGVLTNSPDYRWQRVRLAFMKEFAVPGKDELDGVSRMFRAFAPVDIPEGLAKADPNYDVYEQTLCTSVMCAESGVYYFAPAWNRRISAVRLPAQGTEMQYFDLGDGQDIDWRN